MRSKKRLLRDSRLYVIADTAALKRRSVVETVRCLSASGVGVVQLRDKSSDTGKFLDTAVRLRSVLKDSGTIFIVNDRLDIAKIADSDGVHLGQEDASVKTARRILGSNKIIGVSCHSLAQAQRAQEEGADYIGIGPVFSTPTKPGRRPIGLGPVRKISRTITIPFFAIGGISKYTLDLVLSAGAGRIAVTRAVCRAADIPAAVRTLRKKLGYHDIA